MSTKPPFTESEAAYIKAEIDRWFRTGYGIDPNQPAFRHYDTGCECHFCAGTPITHTRQPPWLWSWEDTPIAPERNG